MFEPFWCYNILVDFKAIKELLSPYDGKDPGCAVTVVHKGIEVFSHTSGFGDLENSILISKESNFRIASITKQFTAIGILILVQEGLLTLDSTLNEFFPTFHDYGKNISMKHLLTHTSGLKIYEDLFDGSTTSVSDKIVLDLLSNQAEGNFMPGTQYQYNNGGYCLLKLIIEKASGKTFGDFMREKLFRPLGMDKTYINEEGLDKILNRVFGYSYKDDVPVRTDQSITSSTVGDGGIYSSITDLAKWDRSFYSNTVLSNNFRNILLEKHAVVDEEKSIYYGLGFFLKKHGDREVAYHSGSSIGFKTGMYTVLNNELSVFFLSNRNGGKGLETAEKIADIVLPQI